VKNGSISRAIAFMNAQIVPSGDTGEMIAADPPGDALIAGPFPLSRTWNENVNESDRDAAPLLCATVGAGNGASDGEVVPGGVAWIVVVDGSVAFGVTVGVGVGVTVVVPASSRSLT
jgi:hypothetical protein